MPFFRSTLLALPCLLLAHAATAREPHRVTDCVSLLKSFGKSIEFGKTGKVEPISDGCHAQDVVISQSEFVSWRIDDLRFTGKDLFAAASAQRMPEALDLTATRFRMSSPGLPPASRYVSEVIQPGLDLHLSYQWNAETHALKLDDLTLQTTRSGKITLKGSLANVMELPEADKRPPKSAQQMALDHLSVHLDNNGIFETLVVAPAISALPPDRDPAPVIAQYQTLATAFLGGLPEMVADGQSKAALRDLVAQFPHPEGTFDIDVTTKTPISVAEFMGARDPAGLSTILAKLSIAARHEKLAQP